MISNKLSVNLNKTEYLLFNPSNINLPVNIINFGSNTISPSDSAKNLGVIFQNDISMDKQSHLLINIASCNCRIFVAVILLSLKQLQSLANAFVHSRLDFCTNLFYGLAKYSIHHVQKLHIQLHEPLHILLIFCI